MSDKNKNIKRVCSFYVSGWHLISMLLPYINKELDINSKIINISEENLEDFVKAFISKLNLDSKKQEQILNINWNNKKANLEDSDLIIVSGNKKYIDKINDGINKKIKGNRKIKIINCYEVMQFNNNINEILRKHDKILNTSGEKEIYEVFEGYETKRDSAING